MSVIKIKKCGTKNSKQEKDSFIKIMENLLKKKYERSIMIRSLRQLNKVNSVQTLSDDLRVQTFAQHIFQSLLFARGSIYLPQGGVKW